MPRFSKPQHSFNAGEWSPRMRGRSDLTQYEASAETITNFQIIPEGPLLRRSGSRYVTPVKDSTAQHYAVTFSFSDATSYVLEFGANTIRFLTDEGLLLQQAVTLAADNTQEFFSLEGHGYRDGDGPVHLTTDGTMPSELAIDTDYYIRYPKTYTVPAADFDNANNEIDITGHDYYDEQGPYRLHNAAGDYPSSLLPDTDYYIIFHDANAIQLSLTRGGSAVTFGGTGTGPTTIFPTEATKRTCFGLSATADGAIIAFSGAAGAFVATPQDPQPIEITTPYAQGELASIANRGTIHIEDVMYIVHQNHPRQKLSRYTAWGFWLEPVDEIDGPYLDQNITANNIQTSAATGHVTVTADTAIFTGYDVGRSLRLYGTTATHWGWLVITSIGGAAFTDASINSMIWVKGDIEPSTDTINFGSAHPFETGELIRSSHDGGGAPGDGVPEPIRAGEDYWARDYSSHRIQLYESKATAVAGGSTGLVDLLAPNGPPAGEVATITGSRITLASHGYALHSGPYTLSNSGGALPDPLSESSSYYIFEVVDANTFVLSTSMGSGEQGIQLATGGGTHTIISTATPSTSAFASIKGEMDAKIHDGTGVTTWRLGAFSSDPSIGYPACIAMHDERVVVANNPGSPQRLYETRAGNFETWSYSGIATSVETDLDDTIEDSNGFQYRIGDGSQNAISWLSSIRSLVLGTAASAWTAGPADERNAATPTNFKARRTGRKGACQLGAVDIDQLAVYLSDTEQRIYAVDYKINSDSYTADDATLRARHIAGLGFTDMALASEPHQTLYVVRQDGKMAALTWIPAEEVQGWHVVEIGGSGVIEQVVTIPSPTGDPSSVGRTNLDHSQVWVIVNRTIEGETVRYWEFFEDFYDENFDTLDEAFFVDCGLTYSGAAATTVSGLTHLAGETVDVLAGGQVYQGLAVTALGVVTLPTGAEAATPWQIGYAFTSDVITQRMYGDSAEGASDSQVGRIDHVTLRTTASLGVKIGPDADNLEDISALMVDDDLATDTLPVPYTGDIEVPFDGDWDDATRVMVRQDKPLPTMVVSLGRKGTASQRGDRVK